MWLIRLKEKAQVKRLLAELRYHTDNAYKLEQEIVRLSNINETLSNANIDQSQKVEQLQRDSVQQRMHFESTIDNLRRRVDEAEHAQRLAESRVGDLKESLQIERNRFDTAIDREREVDDGVRNRIGLIPQPPRQQNGEEIKPIHTRPARWSQTASRLETDSKEEYWRSKIKQAEDKGTVDAGSSGNDAAQGSKSEPSPNQG